MKFLKLKGPVQLPGMHYKDAKSWAKDVNTCLGQIARMGVEVPSAATTTANHHPFQMRTAVVSAQTRLYVRYGMVTVPQLVEDSGGSWILTGVGRNTLIEAGTNQLEGNPAGAASGYIVLSASTTYGVWLKISSGPAQLVEYNHAVTTGDDVQRGSGDWYDRVLSGPYNSGGLASSRLIVSSTSTNLGDEPALVLANAESSFVYIGKVVVDAGGLATISQYLRSDHTVPNWTLPGYFRVSATAGNDLTSNADGPFYDAPP